MITEKSREEAFEAMHRVLIELQRSRTLTYEQTQDLQRVVIDYGCACAQDAARAVRLERRT